MKILLVSVNASYMHTNVAIRSIKTYAESFLLANKDVQFQISEFTINQNIEEVLQNIVFSKSDVILFSTYIWNAEYVCKILPEIKKLLPNCILGAGGPEFGYSAKKYLNTIPTLDFIMAGEGEKIILELVNKLCKNKNYFSVKGIYFRESNGEINFTGNQSLIENLDELPFAYPEILKNDFDPEHKIYYYESTRGCPFGCAYCLSSIDKNVRFKSLKKVQSELKIFLDAKIKLVKFIDRTYNLNPERYIPIWKYILENHNGITMFHFEIEAEYLSDDALDFLQVVPSGVMQFEMGVQSANKTTLKAVNRSCNIEILAEKIKRIPKTIHQHLDLIAGLPFEDLESFGKSYDYVMKLQPDALQLGFLKILEGTQMANIAKENGWLWMQSPIYETFSTPYLSFSDVSILKNVEILTDVFWNKKNFYWTMNYIFRFVSPWNFLLSLTYFAREKKSFCQARKETYWFNLFFDFINDEKNQENFLKLNFNLVNDLLRYDFVRSGKKGNFPNWYKHVYDKDKHKNLLDKYEVDGSSRIKFANSEYELFNYNVLSKTPELESYGIYEILIRY